MASTLVILPESIKSKDSLPGYLDVIRKLYPEEKQEDIFYQNNENSLELKKMLVARKYDLIVIGFVTLSTEFPQVQMVRSLSIGSKMILFCPETDFIKNEMKNHHRDDCDLLKWYELGRSIQGNACRQADLVVVGSPEDRDLLGKKIPGSQVVSFDQLPAGNNPVAPKGQKKISIVILTFNQLADITRCIESLRKHTNVDYELIIVDNGSTDGTEEYLQTLKADDKNVRVILNETNLGFSKANNQGIKIAKGEYVLLLNNDVIFTENWLDRMLLCAESDPLIGVVGPFTNHAVGQQVINAAIAMDDPEIQKFACSNTLQKAGYWFETHRIIGFCMLIKREVLDSIGMLDERFGPGGFEDYDFCLRVKQAGYRIMVASDVFIYHIGGQGYTRNNLDYDKLRQKNIQLFIEKWCKKALEIMEVMPTNI